MVGSFGSRGTRPRGYAKSSADGPWCGSSTRGAKRKALFVIATIMVVSCFALVAHAATDWDDLTSLGLHKTVRLEPTEYGQEDSALKAGADLAAVHLDERSIGTFLSVDNPKTIKLHLRI